MSCHFRRNNPKGEIYCEGEHYLSDLFQRFTNTTTSLDVESLSYVCKVLYTHEPALEIVALHTKLSELLALGLALLEDYDCETVGAFIV